MVRSFALLFCATTLFGIGCADLQADAQDDADSDVADDGKADAVQLPRFTWTLQDGDPGSLSALTLERDKTFHFVGFTDPRCLECTPIQATGTYKLTRSSSGRRYIRFYNAN